MRDVQEIMRETKDINREINEIMALVASNQRKIINDSTMSNREAYIWCSFYAAITIFAIAINLILAR